MKHVTMILICMTFSLTTQLEIKAEIIDKYIQLYQYDISNLESFVKLLNEYFCTGATSVVDTSYSTSTSSYLLGDKKLNLDMAIKNLEKKAIYAWNPVLRLETVIFQIHSKKYKLTFTDQDLKAIIRDFDDEHSQMPEKQKIYEGARICDLDKQFITNEEFLKIASKKLK